MQNKSLADKLLLLGGLGLIAGAYGIYGALTAGTADTALGSAVPWGLGVTAYLYFLGLSGGGLLIALLTKALGQKQFEAFSGIAAWAVVITEICAGIAIAADLGHWERMYRFILSPNLQSPMAWMFFFFAALLIIYCLKIAALCNNNTERAHKLTLWSIPVALLFYLTNGYIFGMISSQPLWAGPFTPVWFLLAALLSGGALLGLLGWAQGFDDSLMRGYGRLLCVLLAAFAVFEALWLLAGVQGSDAETAKALKALLSGSGALAFWGLHVVVGLAVPFFLLFTAKNASGVGLGSLVAALAFVSARWCFVVPPQSAEPLDGLANAFQHARLAHAYAPSSGEWLTALFVFSLCLVALLIGPRIAPNLFSKQGERHV